MADGSLVFDTEINTSGFESDIRRAINESEGAVEPFFQHTLANLASQMISKITETAAQAVSEGIALASDVSEVKNVVDTTFGDNAQTIYVWAEGAKEAFGISNLAAQQYSGTMGAMLKSSGIAASAIDDMSTSLVGLSGDMASFYNLDVGTAFEKIRSGISGETEPLKQLGINMSVANLEAYALAQGIKKSYNEMSQAEQIMLRYQYLLSVTADAQGDFSKTSDSFANQQRIMELNFQNMKQALGEELMPAAQSIIEYVNENADQIIEDIRDVGKTICGVTDFLLENKEILADIAAGAVTAVFAYKGLSTANSAATSLMNLASAASTATSASSALRAVFGINWWSAAIAGAAALGVAIRGLIEEERDLIGYEGEIKEAFNEANKEIAIQNNLLSELAGSGSVTDRKQAYETAKSDISEMEAQYEKNARKIYDLKIALSHVSANVTADPNADPELYSKLEQEIKGLEEQNTLLENALISRRNIVEKYSDFDVAPEHVMNQDILNQQSNNAADALKRGKEKLAQQTAAEQEATAAIKKALSDGWKALDHKYAMGIISDEEQLYNERLKLLNQYGDKSNSEHWSYYEQLYAYKKRKHEEDISEQKKFLDDTVKQTENKLDDINAVYQEKYSDLMNKQRDYRSRLMAVGGNVFTVQTEKDEDGNETTTYKINDIDKQIAAMEAYHEDIKKLKEDGASSALLSEINSMSPEDGSLMADYVANLSEEQRKKVFELYRQKESVADELSSELYAKEAEDMQNAFSAAISDLGITAYESGAAAAEQFAGGFNGKLSELINVSALAQLRLNEAYSSSASAKANSYDNNTEVSVNVNITGGNLTLDGNSIGEYSLDYSQQTDIQKGR